MFSLLLQGSRLGFEYPSVHMDTNAVASGQTFVGGTYGYNTPKSTTRTTKTTTKEFDKHGKVTKEVTVEETVTETSDYYTPYWTTNYTNSAGISDIKLGQSDTKRAI